MTVARKRQIPPVERVRDDNARFALSALKERVEVLDDIRGGRETSAATIQDLIDAGVVQLDRRTGQIVKREEDEQVPFQDQQLLTLETAITEITTADVGAAPAFYSQVYQNQQTALLNECKAKINELIASLRNGLIRK